MAHERAGAGATVVLAGWALLGGHYYNHVLFMFWVALTLLLFRDSIQQRFVVRWQLSIVYGFGALTKVNAEWLSGAALMDHDVRLPELLVRPAAVVAILGEAALAFALWHPRWRRAVIAAAAPLHLSFWLLMGDNVVWAAGLLPFNLLALGLLVWSTGSRDSTHAPPVPAHRAITKPAATPGAVSSWYSRNTS